MSKRVLLTFLTATLTTAAAHADLDSYIKRLEPAFAWKLKEKINHPLGAIYDIEMTSQVWQSIPWRHQIQVYQPKNVVPNATMLIWNTGGGSNAGNVFFGMILAQKIKAPVAILYHIPNQPLFGGKTEDALIAETYVRYLTTKDENWPLLLPMAKSVVKSMDALQAFAKAEFKTPVESFVISGGSKRGWTSWMTAATGDPRVKAIAPMVIDMLNTPKQMPYQVECFGGYSEQIRDYTERGLVPMPNTPEANKLWRMVDPYNYRDKLTLPKMMVNGNNDPYWTVDALNLYWDDLKGPKWVSYVPNAGHGLEEQHANGGQDRDRAINGLAAFVRHQTTGKPLPELSWKHDDAGGKLRVTVKSNTATKSARVWVSHAKTKDFREAKWVEQKATVANDGTIIGTVEPPKDGFLAFYADLEFAIDEIPYHLSTQIRVAGK